MNIINIINNSIQQNTDIEQSLKHIDILHTLFNEILEQGLYEIFYNIANTIDFSEHIDHSLLCSVLIYANHIETQESLDIIEKIARIMIREIICKEIEVGDVKFLKESCNNNLDTYCRKLLSGLVSKEKIDEYLQDTICN